MKNHYSIIDNLSNLDIQEIKGQASKRRLKKGGTVFSEGDRVDAFYIIESGQVSIVIDKCGKKEEISILGAGDYFGEMAIFSQHKRTASAIAAEDTVLLSIEKNVFLEFLSSHPKISSKIHQLLAQRNEELILKENILNTVGIQGNNLHVSIKGDPSLRETTFTRERYTSVIDKFLPQLVQSLEELLINRCVYRIFVGLNNGEVRTSSVFDPFCEEIHTADKLVDDGYLDRHFPKMAYLEKEKLIKGVYGFISDDPHFNQLPDYWKNIFKRVYDHWQPVTKEELISVLRKLQDLRDIQDFYLRNFGVSMIQDAIRMQFNCDGTHIVSAKDYKRFLAENVEGTSS